MKRLIFTVLAIVSASISVQAKYSGGAGTSGNPYKISTAADLLALAANTSDYDANFVLTADINLGGTAATAVIAPDMNSNNLYNYNFDGTPFTGVFDGAGHKIINLNIHAVATENDYLGLFGISGGEIKNLGVENAAINGNKLAFVGCLVGWNGGSISNCYSTGTISGGDISCQMGGLIGSNSGGYISNCYSTCSVTSGINSPALGGLLGANNYGLISNCYSAGTVTYGHGSYQVGALIGFNPGGFGSGCYFLNISGPNNNNGKSLTDTQMEQQASFVGWDFVNIWQINEGVDYPTLTGHSDTGGSVAIKVTKCAVAVGSKGDSISFSGTMNAAFDDFNNADDVNITISCSDMNVPYVQIFDINDKTFKKGKFSSTVTNKTSKTSFAFDTKKTTFSFSASNVDLTGLSCLVGIEMKIGDWTGTAEVNEAIVNGAKPMPINLFMGVKNYLRVDKSKFTKKSGVVTQVAISGGFSVKNIDDANLITSPLDVNVGSQKFTIPAHNFKNAKGKFTCSKVDTSHGIAAATFDFNKCTFTLTIKNTNFAAASGTSDLDIGFASFSGSDEVTLP